MDAGLAPPITATICRKPRQCLADPAAAGFGSKVDGGLHEPAIGGSGPEGGRVGISEEITVRTFGGDVGVAFAADCGEAGFHFNRVGWVELVARCPVQDAVFIYGRDCREIGR